MTIEDLREQDVLLPEREWGSHRLETTVPEWPLAAALFVAAGCLVAAYVGDGGPVTWAAVGVFLATLYLITWLADRAVLEQRRRFRRERRAVGDGGRGDGSSAEDAPGGVP